MQQFSCSYLNYQGRLCVSEKECYFTSSLYRLDIPWENVKKFSLATRHVRGQQTSVLIVKFRKPASANVYGGNLSATDSMLASTAESRPVGSTSSSKHTFYGFRDILAVQEQFEKCMQSYTARAAEEKSRLGQSVTLPSKSTRGKNHHSEDSDDSEDVPAENVAKTAVSSVDGSRKDGAKPKVSFFKTMMTAIPGALKDGKTKNAASDAAVSSSEGTHQPDTAENRRTQTGPSEPQRVGSPTGPILKSKPVDFNMTRTTKPEIDTEDSHSDVSTLEKTAGGGGSVLDQSVRRSKKNVEPTGRRGGGNNGDMLTGSFARNTSYLSSSGPMRKGQSSFRNVGSSGGLGEMTNQSNNAIRRHHHHRHRDQGSCDSACDLAPQKRETRELINDLAYRFTHPTYNDTGSTILNFLLLTYVLAMQSVTSVGSFFFCNGLYWRVMSITALTLLLVVVGAPQYFLSLCGTPPTSTEKVLTVLKAIQYERAHGKRDILERTLFDTLPEETLDATFSSTAGGFNMGGDTALLRNGGIWISHSSLGGLIAHAARTGNRWLHYLLGLTHSSDSSSSSGEDSLFATDSDFNNKEFSTAKVVRSMKHKPQALGFEPDAEVGILELRAPQESVRSIGETHPLSLSTAMHSGSSWVQFTRIAFTDVESSLKELMTLYVKTNLDVLRLRAFRVLRQREALPTSFHFIDDVALSPSLRGAVFDSTKQDTIHSVLRYRSLSDSRNPIGASSTASSSEEVTNGLQALRRFSLHAVVQDLRRWNDNVIGFFSWAGALLFTGGEALKGTTHGNAPWNDDDHSWGRFLVSFIPFLSGRQSSGVYRDSSTHAADDPRRVFDAETQMFITFADANEREECRRLQKKMFLTRETMLDILFFYSSETGVPLYKRITHSHRRLTSDAVKRFVSKLLFLRRHTAFMLELDPDGTATAFDEYVDEDFEDGVKEDEEVVYRTRADATSKPQTFSGLACFPEKKNLERVAKDRRTAIKKKRLSDSADKSPPPAQPSATTSCLEGDTDEARVCTHDSWKASPSVQDIGLDAESAQKQTDLSDTERSSTDQTAALRSAEAATNGAVDIREKRADIAAENTSGGNTASRETNANENLRSSATTSQPVGGAKDPAPPSKKENGGFAQVPFTKERREALMREYVHSVQQSQRAIVQKSPKVWNMELSTEQVAFAWLDSLDVYLTAHTDEENYKKHRKMLRKFHIPFFSSARLTTPLSMTGSTLDHNSRKTTADAAVAYGGVYVRARPTLTPLRHHLSSKFPSTGSASQTEELTKSWFFNGGGAAKTENRSSSSSNASAGLSTAMVPFEQPIEVDYHSFDLLGDVLQAGYQSSLPLEVIWEVLRGDEDVERDAIFNSQNTWRDRRHMQRKRRQLKNRDGDGNNNSVDDDDDGAYADDRNCSDDDANGNTCPKYSEDTDDFLGKEMIHRYNDVFLTLLHRLNDRLQRVMSPSTKWKQSKTHRITGSQDGTEVGESQANIAGSSENQLGSLNRLSSSIGDARESIAQLRTVVRQAVSSAVLGDANKSGSASAAGSGAASKMDGGKLKKPVESSTVKLIETLERTDELHNLWLHSRQQQEMELRRAVQDHPVRHVHRAVHDKRRLLNALLAQLGTGIPSRRKRKPSVTGGGDSAYSTRSIEDDLFERLSVMLDRNMNDAIISGISTENKRIKTIFQEEIMDDPALLVATEKFLGFHFGLYDIPGEVLHEISVPPQLRLLDRKIVAYLRWCWFFMAVFILAGALTIYLT